MVRAVDQLRADGARMMLLAPRDLTRAVPACPGWDVREVMRHTGSVYTHKIACMRLGRRALDGEWPREPAPGEDVVLWYGAALEGLIAEITSRDLGQTTFTWYEPDQTVGFWLHRMMLETVVHRMDVESPFGETTGVAHDVASEGIDEVLRCFLCYRNIEPDAEGPWGSVRIASAGGEWWVRLAEDSPSMAENIGADATVQGKPADVFAWLWGRGPLDRLRTDGDPALVTALRRRLARATD